MGRAFNQGFKMSLAFCILMTFLIIEFFFYGIGKIWLKEGSISQDSDEEIFPTKEIVTASIPVETSLFSKKERIIHELDFTSLSDILLGSHLPLKRGAIERLYQLKTPEAIRLLMQHRNDPHPDVRFYVTAALERIKHDYESDFHSAYLEMKKDIYKNSARLLLARRYIEYRHSGLLDEALNQTYFEEALFHLNEIIKSEVPLEESYWLLLDLYKEQTSKYKNEIFKLHQLLEKNGGDFQRIKKSKIEVFFSLKQYAEMKRELSGMSKDPEWASVASWWGAVS